MHNHSSVPQSQSSPIVHESIAEWSCMPAFVASCIPLRRDRYTLRRDGCIMRSDGCILRSDGSKLKWTGGEVDKASGSQPRGCRFETNCSTNSLLLLVLLLKIHDNNVLKVTRICSCIQKLFYKVPRVCHMANFWKFPEHSFVCASTGHRVFKHCVGILTWDSNHAGGWC